MANNETLQSQETISTIEIVTSAAVFVGGVVLEKLIPGAIYAGLIGSTALFIDGIRRSP